MATPATTPEPTASIVDKSASLLARLDLDRPELASLRGAADPLATWLALLQRPDRGRFRVEYTRPVEILDFLRAHYAGWRPGRPGVAAERLAAMTLEQARGARATAAVGSLGQAWLATGDATWGAAFERFYLGHPTGNMFNWSNFNGTQAAEELNAWFLLLDCPGFTQAGRVAFLDHLFAIVDNAWNVHTSNWSQTMLGPEGHNWYLHGMHGVPLVALLFPEMRGADRLLRCSWSVVEEHVRAHYRADGGARETNLAYQVGSMLNLWDLYLIAQRNGHPVSAGFVDTLLRGTHFVLRLAAPDGGIPSFGDGGHGPGQLTQLAAIAAALTGDTQAKWYAERFRRHQTGDVGQTPGALPLNAFWHVGLAGAATYAATRAQDPHPGSVLMPQTGYAALRANPGSDSPWLAIAAADRGPIVTSHGHNDVFAIDVHAFGKRFIGELGCVSYGTTPGRGYDLLTAAHSTLAIDGMEQAPIVSEWRWSRSVIPAVRRWIDEPTHTFFHATHEGFYDWPNHQTLHARKVLLLKGTPSCYLIFDWIESNVEVPAAIHFHATTAGHVQQDALLLGLAPYRLAVIPPQADGLTPTLVDDPGRAAYFTEKQLDMAAHHAFAYRRSVRQHCFVWLLAPVFGHEPMPTLHRLPLTLNSKLAEPHLATAVEVRWADRHVDRVMVSHRDFDADIHFGDEPLAFGHLAIRRLTPDGTLAHSITHRMADGAAGR